MNSTNNKGKSVIVGRFIRNLKNKILKYMASISKNIFIDKLDDKASKYNNTCLSTIKMKPVDVKSRLVVMLKYQNINYFYKSACS